MFARLLRSVSSLGVLGVLGVLAVNPVFAADKRDVGAEAKAVFEVKCVQCHGPKVRKPEGDFGYILDLKRLAADPKKVVPSKPDESKLWQLVRDDEMPAEDAKAGPLTEEQKKTIHDWIEAGAPPPFTKEDTSSSAPAPQAKNHLLDWLGNLHVMVIHFPIGLLLAAAVGELWFAWRSVRQPAPAVGFCVFLGTISAIVAAVLGWLHAASGSGAGSPVLPWHRWFGTATAAGTVILVVLSAIDIRRGVRRWWFRLLLLLAAVLVAVTGYFGGVLVYGVDYFRW